jgi:hypothetical protein
VDEPTAGTGRGERTPGEPAPAPDDPRARAKADVRAFLAEAFGLRRLVELAAEFGGADAPRPEAPRARYRRPGPRPTG